MTTFDVVIVLYHSKELFLFHCFSRLTHDHYRRNLSKISLVNGVELCRLMFLAVHTRLSKAVSCSLDFLITTKSTVDI